MTTHKQYAVDMHHAQAPEFEHFYEEMSKDVYASTFTYGRAKIEALIDRELDARPDIVRALDVGCGVGFNVARLRARKMTVVGVEPAEGMRVRATEMNPGAEIIDGDIEQLPFKDGAFDLVIAIEVIRYLEDPARALAECARVLRPGGLAIVTAAPLCSLNGYALFNQLSARVRVPGFNKVKHSFLTEHGARRLSSQAGFASVDVHGAFIGPWHALQRFAPRVSSRIMRALEPLDDRISDKPVLRDLSNHLILVCHR